MHFNDLNQITKESFENWIFDLDNTIYDNKIGLFKKISERITLFIMDNFSMKKKEAEELRRRMFLEYGLTLRGLMLEKSIDPDIYLNFIHNVSYPELEVDLPLKNFLNNLKGKKFIYTNASMDHSLKVMDGMGIADEFDDILDIKGTGFIPKPDHRSYSIMVKKFKISEDQLARSIFFEDTAKNLKPAKQMGLSTVWIENKFNLQDYKLNKRFVDFRCNNIKDFFKSIHLYL